MTDEAPDPAPADPATKAGTYSARIIGSMAEIDAAAWDACNTGDDPFVRHAYLRALEDSGSVSERTGFRPRHVAILSPDRIVVAVAPAYIKTHSEGEYGTDKNWDRAYPGGSASYYPKLQVEVPLTPIAGRRLLVRPDQPQRPLRQALIQALADVTRSSGLSSLHVNYADADDAAVLRANGMLVDTNLQLHWQNRGYRTFEDFLANLRGKRRSEIRRERKRALVSGLTITWHEGGTLEPALNDRFYPLYANTNRRYEAKLLLTPAFFHALHRSMPDRLCLALVHREGDVIAGALFLRGGDVLHARYWGSLENVKFLHFETALYQAIDYAISHGLKWVHGGSGGPHKVRRGFLPAEVHHAHWFRHRGFHDSIGRGLASKARREARAYAELMKHSPYASSEGR